MGKRIKNKSGFSTIELMIAMAVMVLTMSAVIILSFGSQTFLIGSQTNNEAMKIAQRLIEQQQALARKDFNLVNPKAVTTDDIYNKSVLVTLLPDLLTKKVETLVEWIDEKYIERTLKLTTLISNFSGATSGDTCDSTLQGNWTSPTKSSKAVSLLTGLSASISDLDAYKDEDGNKIAVALQSTPLFGDKNFFIFDLSSSGIPSYGGPANGIDTSGTGSTKGPKAITIASPSLSDSAPTKKTYAFIANGVTPVAWTCAQGPSCSQFQVIDVTDSIPNLLVNLRLPGVNGITSGQGVGKSIFYRNGYIFLGLSKTASGPEFHIIDVHQPDSPIPIGSFSVGYGVEAIYSYGNFAYLATNENNVGGNGTLMVLDISNPSMPKKVWPNIFSSSFGYGNILTRVGDFLYFGMTYNSTNPELFVLKNEKPSSVAPSNISSSSINLGGSLGVNGIIVRDYLINILTSGNILRIHNTIDSTEDDISLPGDGTAMDCQGNYLFIGDNSGNITSITAN